jgi:PH (Pleckstrin Homology) domain-containing protein
VDLRAPTPQPDRERPDPDGTAAPAYPAAEPVAWRVDRRLTIAKWAGAAVFTLAAVVGYPDWSQVIVVGFAAALVAVLALRDVLAPVRLAADTEGVTILIGFAGRRRIGWPQIERVRVDARRGVVLRSQVLELDTGDNLHFFSINDLGVAPQEVAERLAVLRSRSGL